MDCNLQEHVICLFVIMSEEEKEAYRRIEDTRAQIALAAHKRYLDDHILSRQLFVVLDGPSGTVAGGARATDDRAVDAHVGVGISGGGSIPLSRAHSTGGDASEENPCPTTEGEQLIKVIVSKVAAALHNSDDAIELT